MVPLLSLFEAKRTRSWKPLLTIAPNLAGFLLAVIPVASWLHFHGIFADFVDWCVVNPAQMVALSWSQLGHFLNPGASLWVYAALCGAGCAVLLARANGAAAISWSPIAGLLLGTVLAWSIRALEPYQLDYILQASVMPAAVLGSLALNSLRHWDPRWLRKLLLAAALVLILWRPIVTEGIGMGVLGVPVESAAMEEMIRRTRGPDATCVGFAPYHPIFCRDATDIYNIWDMRFTQVDWVTEIGKQPYRDMWPRAIEDILAKKPVLILSGPWVLSSGMQLVSEEQYQSFLQLIESEYESIELGEHRAWVRISSGV
jgi:hypothetical protein